MRRRGFSLIELMFVIVILGILLALGFGALSRYRSNLALGEAVNRLVAEAGNAQAQARAFGLPQTRNGNPLPTTPTAGNASVPGNAALIGRIREKRASQGLVTTKEWMIGEEGGKGVRCEIAFNNLPSLPMSQTVAGDQGVIMEIIQGTPSGIPAVLGTLAFEPDGRVRTIQNNLNGQIYVSRGDVEYTITVTPLGKVTSKKTR